MGFEGQVGKNFLNYNYDEALEVVNYESSEFCRDVNWTGTNASPCPARMTAPVWTNAVVTAVFACLVIKKNYYVHCFRL